MPGILPNEGENLILNIILKRAFGTDRDANLELGLITNLTIAETLAHAGITEPAGTGYARIDLNDGTWAVVADLASYAQQTFTAGAGGWAGEVQGYFISTKAAGGTKRLLQVELDSQMYLAAGALTRAGGIATVNTPINHPFATGDRINVRLANEADYNGIFPITVTGAAQFTYAVPNAPASPATGPAAPSGISINRCYIMNANDNYRVTPQLLAA